jgi:hypothetical protein
MTPDVMKAVPGIVKEGKPNNNAVHKSIED